MRAMNPVPYVALLLAAGCRATDEEQAEAPAVAAPVGAERPPAHHEQEVRSKRSRGGTYTIRWRPAEAPDEPPVFSDLPAAVREGRSVLLECRSCQVAYEVPARMARARLRCKTCRESVTLREIPVSRPDPLDAGHAVQVLEIITSI